MTTRQRNLLALIVAMPLAAVAVEAGAQQSPVVTHIGHVATGFPGAPDGAALMAVAQADAAVAAQHAGLAARDPGNLQAMQTHAGHVLRALDPAEGSQGPGSGYGVVQATAGVVTHLGLAARSAEASDNVTTHAEHITASTETASARAAEAADVARQIQAASSAANAAQLTARLQELTAAIVEGSDANGDGRVGWQAGEGGLEQAEQHLALLRRGEGI